MCCVNTLLQMEWLCPIPPPPAAGLYHCDHQFSERERERMCQEDHTRMKYILTNLSMRIYTYYENK